MRFLKSNDLRCGNFVHHNEKWCYRDSKGPFDFQWTDRDWVALAECTLSLENISGIPLTKEWMQKLGAISGERGGWRDCWIFDQRGAQISIAVAFLHDCVRIYLNGTYFEVNDYYVHQLQNLYYSINLKELSIV